MRTHRETFEPVCADGTRSFDAFLAAEVEAMVATDAAEVDPTVAQVDIQTAVMEVLVAVVTGEGKRGRARGDLIYDLCIYLCVVVVIGEESAKEPG